MKKNFKLLCLIFSIVLAIVAFVACEEEQHEHSWNDGTVTKEATCTEKGSKLFTCSGCDETKTEEIDTIAHTEKDVGVELPTCTMSGLTAGKVCAVCDATIVAREFMPKLGHDLDENKICTRCSFEFYTDGLIFEVSGGGNNYTVVGYEGTDTEVVIPSKYNGLPVVAIADEAFKGNEVMEKISISNSVTSIGESAFYECTSLKSVIVPSGVTVINDFTFYKCKKLNEIAFAGDITSIGDNAFEFCEKLGSITIPNSCESIGADAFGCCYVLDGVTLPLGLTSLGAGAFSYCENLGTIAIPAGVETIAGRTFFHCTSLSNVTIPEGVKKIEAYAFQTCEILLNVSIPASVTEIEPYAFAYSGAIRVMTVHEDNTVYDSRDNCNAIIETATNTIVVGCWKTIIPDTVTAIGEAAFFGCDSLSSINIPESVVSLGKSAFSGCKDLTSIVIPTSITEIPEGLLAGCSYLRTIYIDGDVTKIGSGAFRGTDRLEKVVLPASLQEIAEDAFAYASAIATIYFRGTGAQWNEIIGHDSVELNNYQINGRIIFNYDEE